MRTENPKIAAMNAARKRIKERKKNLDATVTANLIAAENARLKEQIEKLTRVLDEERARNAKQTLSDAHEVLESSKIEQANPILVDLLQNSLNGGEYAPETLSLASTILSISPKCFKYIENSIPFPSEYIIKKQIKIDDCL